MSPRRTEPHPYVPRADEDVRTCALCGFGPHVNIHTPSPKDTA